MNDDISLENQMTLFDYTRPMFKIDNPIRLIEMFSGYGSQAMALRNIGANFEKYRVFDNNKNVIASYNAIHNTSFEPKDICDVNGKDLGIVDKDKYTYICVYSFPCTSISIAGRMDGMVEGSDTSSSLIWEVKRILNELNIDNDLPQVLVMENVPTIHNADNTPHFRKWLTFLDNLGYSTYVQDLNSYDYGVAQSRERTVAVSILGLYNYKFPTTMKLYKRAEDYFEDLDKKQAIKYIEKSDKSYKLLTELKGIDHIGEYTKEILILGGIGVNDRQNRDSMRVLSGKGVMYCLKSHTDKEQPLVVKPYRGNESSIKKYLYNGYGVFKLTERECGRLMGVRDSDIDKMASVNKKTQLYAQFGNSIVVTVLMAVFSQLNIFGVKPWNEMTQEEREDLIERSTK